MAFEGGGTEPARDYLMEGDLRFRHETYVTL
jgi:hypothetical protein